MVMKAGEIMVEYSKIINTGNAETLTFMVRNAEILVSIAQAHYMAANVRGRA